MSRSASKKKKQSPRRPDISLAAEDVYRPKLWNNKSTKNKNRKSHQGSSMIGADTGFDWPLKPMNKG